MSSTAYIYSEPGLNTYYPSVTLYIGYVYRPQYYKLPLFVAVSGRVVVGQGCLFFRRKFVMHRSNVDSLDKAHDESYKYRIVIEWCK